jgi:hypothetical protein
LTAEPGAFQLRRGIPPRENHAGGRINGGARVSLPKENGTTTILWLDKE